MNQAHFFPDWHDKVIYAEGGPKPQVLHEDDKVKVVVVGLEAGGQIPIHPGDAGVYHILEGTGKMKVGEETFDVKIGGTVLVPAGAARGMTAQTRLAFIAVRFV